MAPNSVDMNFERYKKNVVAVAETYPDCRTELFKDAESSITRIRGALRDT